MIDINICEKKWDTCFKSISVLINRVICAIPQAKNKKISILLTNDAHIKELNNQFRKKNNSTNVLSFPYDDFPDGTIGDIVLALETIKQEAEDQSISFKEHMSHMLIHGVLHLLGYTHDENEEAETMEKLEAEILSKLINTWL